jgi:serine/threonine-protein kinase HipA
VSTPIAQVYVDLHGVPRLVGQLFASGVPGRETTTFMYDQEWLRAADRFALAPAIAVSEGPHYPRAGGSLFGALSDSAPDRWGETLLRRAERRRARAEGRTPRTLREIDFLLGVSDLTRQGALRFSKSKGGEFVAPGDPRGVPPLVDLRRLLDATDRFLADDESEADLRLLLAPGSSLGGARPKASVRDPGGHLLIAKFPKSDDPYRVVAWEAVALELAAKAGIAVAGHRLDRSADRDVLLVNRFDRRGAERVPYLSAMSMLDAFDGEPRSYLEIADAIREHGAAAKSDLPELWRRIVFNVLISNTDDHLRNHGFLYDGPAGWRLSPAFDLNPVPVDIKQRVLATSIGFEEDSTTSLAAALDVADTFDLRPEAARATATDVAKAVSQWRKIATRVGVAAAEIERMASAFEHDDLAAARKLAR